MKSAGLCLMTSVLNACAIPTGTENVNQHETVVIREIQTIHQAETQYKSQFGRYATLTQLGSPANGSLGPQAADLIPSSFASGDEDGYLFVVKLTPSGYTVNAQPKIYNETGRRTFYSDQSMAIRQNWSAEPASATSPEVH